MDLSLGGGEYKYFLLAWLHIFKRSVCIVRVNVCLFCISEANQYFEFMNVAPPKRFALFPASHLAGFHESFSW